MPQHDEWDFVDPPVSSSRFAGQVTITNRLVSFEDGHTVDYDPTRHTKAPAAQLHFTIEPLDTTRKFIEQKSMNFAQHYKKVLWPSIMALTDKIAAIRNLQAGQFNAVRELRDLWVIGEWVAKPENKPARKGPNGEDVPAETWTTIRFIDVFATRAECEAAYGVANPETEPAPVADSPAPSPIADPQKAAMAAFLPALWAQSGKDITKFAELLHSNPLLSGHFTLQSPEVLAVVAPAF